MIKSDNAGSNATDALIAGLAAQAGKRQSRGPGFGIAFPVAIGISALAALAVVLLTAGARPDLVHILLTGTFLFKVAGMALIAAGALRSVWGAVQPGVKVRPLVGLLPGAVFLLFGAMLDGSGFPVLGVHTFSVPSCAASSSSPPFQPWRPF